MSFEGAGFNGTRRIFDGSDIGSEIENIRGTMDYPSQFLVVVEDVLINPKKLTPIEIKEIQKRVSNPEVVKRAPRNSIIGRVITRGQDMFDSTSKIFFPHKQHDVDPILPGEQVVAYYIDPLVNNQIGYWSTRISQTVDSDDLNFTHADRKYHYNENLSLFDKLKALPPEPPGFDNGGGLANDREQFSLLQANAYDQINKKATANSHVVKEPVARFDKRPGDKVIQGSNGSRIVLGMDRDHLQMNPPRAKSPSIDIVVGYGYDGTPTSPKTIINKRGELEVNKAPEKNNDTDNPLEGEMDYINDKSRIYISANTNLDKNFSTALSSIPPQANNTAGIGIKSDIVRIDSRDNSLITAGQLNGIFISNTGVVSVVSNGVVNLGSHNAKLGVARLNDQITIDNSTDQSFMVFMNYIHSALTLISEGLSTLGVVVPSPQDVGVANPSQIFGTISTASAKVKSE